MGDAQPCDGFPDACPYLLTVEPNPPRQDGGVRCGCNARQDLEDMALELATGLGLVDPREYKATLDRYAEQVCAAGPVSDDKARKQVERLDQMATYWAERLPDTILTATAVYAIHQVTREV